MWRKLKQWAGTKATRCKRDFADFLFFSPLSCHVINHCQWHFPLVDMTGCSWFLLYVKLYAWGTAIAASWAVAIMLKKLPLVCQIIKAKAWCFYAPSFCVMKWNVEWGNAEGPGCMVGNSRTRKQFSVPLGTCRYFPFLQVTGYSLLTTPGDRIRLWSFPGVWKHFSVCVQRWAAHLSHWRFCNIPSAPSIVCHLS